MKQYALNPDVLTLYKSILIEVYEQAIGNEKNDIITLKKQLNEYYIKITKARELLLSGDLDGSDYRIIKGDCERQVSIIEGKLVQFSGRNDGIGALLEKAMKTASRLTEIYESADIQGKRKLIS